jgi:hypothetical protein
LLFPRPGIATSGEISLRLIAQFSAIGDDIGMTSLQLNLSTRSTASDKAPDLRPKALKAWLGELPMGHAIQAGQQILEHLRAINQSFVTAATRHAALELLHPSVHKLCATLQRSHRDASFPLPAGHCLMTTLCQQLLEEMANGYKQVITDRLLDDAITASLEALTQAHVDKILLLSLWRAVNYLSAQLLECYLIYAPDPEGAWQDLHRLYRFAEQHLLHIYAVEVAPDDPPDPVTLVECYKRILLLSLCNPYHLMPDEVGTLFHQLAGWSAVVKLSRIAGNQTLTGSFVVDLDCDAPPRYAPPSKPVVAPAQGRLIDVSALLQRLDEHVQQLRATLKDKQYRHQPCLTERREYDLYARLKHSWEMRQDRRFARNAQPNNIMMVAGLSACHHFISAMAPFTPEEDESALRDYGAADDDDSQVSRPPATRPAQSEGDVWDRVYAKAPAPAEQPPSPSRDAVQYSTNPWQQRNAGRGGLAVFCVNDCRASVRVGELVTYKRNPTASSDHWHVGVIRWLRAPDFASVELGIMDLTEQAQAVATRALRGTGGGGDYARSLLVSHIDNATVVDALITPPTIYDEGTLLLVNLGDRLLRVKLVELVEATRTFARFHYTTI